MLKSKPVILKISYLRYISNQIGVRRGRRDQFPIEKNSCLDLHFLNSTRLPLGFELHLLQRATDQISYDLNSQQKSWTSLFVLPPLSVLCLFHNQPTNHLHIYYYYFWMWKKKEESFRILFHIACLLLGCYISFSFFLSFLRIKKFQV